MAQQKLLLSKMSIYIPRTKRDQKPMERLIKLGRQRDRSINYLVVEAILAFLETEEV